MRHDRSIINAYGSPWPKVADAVRASTVSSAPAPPPHLSIKKRAGDSVRERRRALGVTQRELAQVSGYASPGPVAAIERGTGWAAAIRRITLTLDRLEDQR